MAEIAETVEAVAKVPNIAEVRKVIFSLKITSLTVFMPSSPNVRVRNEPSLSPDLHMNARNYNFFSLTAVRGTFVLKHLFPILRRLEEGHGRSN